MSYTAVQDQPISVNLLIEGLTTGWSEDGVIANHQSCNDGFITLVTYPVITGHTYSVSFQVISLSGTSPYVRLYAGDTTGVVRTTTGFFTETITATGTDPQIQFYSVGNSSIENFNIQDTIVNVDNKKQNTIC